MRWILHLFNIEHPRQEDIVAERLQRLLNPHCCEDPMPNAERRRTLRPPGSLTFPSEPDPDTNLGMGRAKLWLIQMVHLRKVSQWSLLPNTSTPGVLLSNETSTPGSFGFLCSSKHMTQRLSQWEVFDETACFVSVVVLQTRKGNNCEKTVAMKPLYTEDTYRCKAPVQSRW